MLCEKARTDAQFGKTYSGEVAVTMKGVKRVHINMDADEKLELAAKGEEKVRKYVDASYKELKDDIAKTVKKKDV